MREYIVNNKSRIIKILVLLFVFLFIVTYFHGRSVYMEKAKMLEEGRMTTG
jgi:hypothetical protein